MNRPIKWLCRLAALPLLIAAFTPIHAAEASLTLRRTVIPILADGEPYLLLDLDLVLEKPHTLTSARFVLDGTSDLADLLTLRLQVTAGKDFAIRENPKSAVTLDGTLQLPAGVHHLQVLGTIRKGAVPLHTIALTCTGLTFDDGRTWPAGHRILLDEKGGAYSSLVMVDDNSLGILYESYQADMIFQKILLSELIE